jgi:16S rRNA (adenine1518-N6/adenine1519-N6)-dimethyltransferase
MGQNFLTDSTALNTIVQAANLTTADIVIEVGPGLGVLTWELLHLAGQVLSVELDRRLAARLREEFASWFNFTLVEGDILTLPPAAILAAHHAKPDGNAETQRRRDVGGVGNLGVVGDGDAAPIARESALPQTANATVFSQSYKVVANLPYAITAPVLRHFLEAAPAPSLMVVLVQWEVAQRITAAPGDLSVLAHAVQFYAEPEIVARVPASSFLPAPKVDSAVLRLRQHPTTLVPPTDADSLFRVIKAAFLQPRKKLANALPTGLAAMGQPIPRDKVIATLATIGVDPERRAETVRLAEWKAVWEALHQT